jgi:tight adherence protein B
MSSYVLGALPLVAGIFFGLTNPDYMSVLFTDPSGRNLLLLAAILLFIGSVVMRTMIIRSQS